MKFSACGVEDFPHPLVYDKENLCLIIVVNGDENKMWHFDISRKLTWEEMIDQVFNGEKPNNLEYVDNEKDVVRLGSKYEWSEFLKISENKINGRLTASSDSCMNLDDRCCLPYVSYSDTESSSSSDMSAVSISINKKKLVATSSDSLDLDAKLCGAKKKSVNKMATSLAEEDRATAARLHCERVESKNPLYMAMDLAQMQESKRRVTVLRRKQFKKKPEETSSSSEAPLWFTTYMKKFVTDINDEIDRTVTRRLEKLGGNYNSELANMKLENLKLYHDTQTKLRNNLLEHRGEIAKNLLKPVKTPAVESIMRSGPVELIHKGIKCQVCKSAIVGIRYKCGHCLDFDLCAACEKEEVHDPDHIFIKIRRPLPDFQEDNTRTRLLPPYIYSNVPSSTRKQREPETGMETNIKMNFDAKFLFDENVPDGTQFLPGERFTKRWRMVNFGSQQWDSDTKLKFLWGSNGFRPSFVDIPVSHLKPRQNGLLSVQYIAPSRPGFYENHFTLTHKGHPFGHRIWCNIEVTCSPSSDNEECFKSLGGVLSLEPENGESQNPNKSGLSKNGTAQEDDLKQSTSSDDTLSEDASEASAGVNRQKSPEKSTCGSTDSSVIPDLVSIDNVCAALQDAEGSVVQDSENASVVNVSSSSSESEFIVVPMPDCFNLMKPCILGVEDEDLPTCSGSLGEQKLLECTGVKEKSLSASSSIIFLSPEGEEEIGAKYLKFDLEKETDYSCKGQTKTKEQRKCDEVKLATGLTSFEIELPSPDCGENNPFSTPDGNVKRESLASIFDSALQWVTIPPDDNGDFIDAI